MSFRKNWLPNLVTWLLTVLLFKQQLWPWEEKLIDVPQDRLLRLIGCAFGLSLLLLGLLRARAWLGPVLRRRAFLLRRLTELKASRTPGTAVAAFQPAFQAPAFQPTFINTNHSEVMLQEFARQQRTARIAGGNG
jgi:hypothetical protein